MFHQAEMAECGLASLAMVAAYHGHDLDLNGLRQRHAVSLKGATLPDLIGLADTLGLSCRPLRLEPEHLPQLQLPCILHWDLNHFVVLKSVRGERVVIHDPARGIRELNLAAFSRSFSGIALELTPSEHFKPQAWRLHPRLRDLWSRLVGWQRPLAHTVVLSVLLQVFALAMPAYLQLVVDDAVPQLNQPLLLALALGFGAMVLLQTGAEALRAWTVLLLGQALSFQLSGNVLRHLLRLPAGYFEKRLVGDVVSRLGSVQPIQEALSQSAVTALIDGLMALATAGLLLAYSPALGAWVLASVGLYLAVVVLLHPRRRLREEELLVTTALSQAHLMESVRSIKATKLFGREVQREIMWRHRHSHVLNAQTGAGRLDIAMQAARSLCFGLQYVGVVYLGARMVMQGELSAGMLFAVLLYRAQFSERAEALIKHGQQFRLLQLHLQRLADIVYTPREPGLDQAPSLQRPVLGALSVQGVDFRFADNEPLLLKDLSLQVAAGEFIAIVGASGGGKTTLLKLMLGLLQPTAGEIHLEGMPAAAFGVQAWRQSVGVVQQDDGLLIGTVAENIAFYDAHLDMARVTESARAAGLHDEIMAMPMAYLSVVAELGGTLSGGQRQRLLLARALYRQPKLLFLDEGTANLDPANERRIADLVQAMPITRIVIAHRPELVQRADTVYELRDGQLHRVVAA